MGRASRTKGSRGELEAAALIRSAGFAAERTGRNGRTSEDVTHDVPGAYIEVKRDQRLSVDAMVRQVETHAEPGTVPTVLYRRDLQPWRVVIPASEWLRLKALERDTATPLRKAA